MLNKPLNSWPIVRSTSISWCNAHGGLNSPKASARRIAAMKEVFKDNGIYPFHIMYDTGIVEELKDLILRKEVDASERTGGFSDWTDRFLEGFGTSSWNLALG